VNNLTIDNPGLVHILNLLLRLPAIVIVLTLHGFVKAALSTKFGNPVPGREKRLTLNPLRHIDGLGFLVFCICGYGWGKPVNTNGVYFKNRKRDIIISNTVPALCCLALGFVSAVAAHILAVSPDSPGFVTGFFLHLYSAAVSLFFINLIPIYPMDAASILRALLSPRIVVKYAAREKLLQIVLLLFIWIGIADILFGFCADFLLSAVGGMLGL
jgi:Zn-dependent protease